MLKRSLNEREKLITKIIAFALIVTLTIANFLLVGKETYAIFESTSSEEGLIENLEIRTKSAIEKYFKIDSVGSVIQMDVNATIDGNAELEDTAEYEIQVNLPKIEEITPKEVYIITRLEMQNIDYTKEYEEGILKIKGNIDRNTRSKDFKVVCIYPEEIYISEEREINWNVIAQANNKKVYEEEYKDILSTKINSQNIAEKIRVEGIYKGIINNNEGNISTSYGEYVDIETSYLQNTSLNFIEKETKYQDNEIAKTYYKKTIFSMENLKRTLGEDFKVTIKYQEEEIIIDKDTEVQEGTDKIVITYPENTTQIEIATTELKDNQNPIIFGNIKELVTNKQEKDLKQIGQMSTIYSFNSQEEKTFNIELKNPYLKTDIKLGENKLELTSLADNNVDIFVTLNADEEYKDRLMLYDNPSFKIQMPENVKVKELKDVSIQAGGNLTLNEVQLDSEGNIIVTLNGKQEDYIKDKNNAQIKINAILEVDKLINNKQGYIRCEAVNKGQEDVFEDYSNEINITTYSNLFTYLKVEGFNEEETIEIYKDGTDVKQINPIETNGKTVNINLQAINNYNIDLKDVIVKANAKYTNKDGKETELNMMTQNNQYSEEKIDLNNLTKYSNNLRLTIPESLNYNEKIDIEIETIYSIDGKQNQIKQNVTLYTENKIMNTMLMLEEVEEGKITLQTVATLADGTVLKEGDSVYAGETITYTTTIINGTNEELKNVKVKAIIENGNIWGLKGEERTNDVAYEGVRIEYKYAELDTNEVTFDTIETLGKEPVILKHEAVVKQNIGKNIISTLQVECDNRQKEEIKNINKIEESELKVNISRRLTEACDVYSTYDLDTAIRLENTSNKDLKDIILKVYLKDGLQWEEGKNIYVYDEKNIDELDIAEIKSYDETNKILAIKIKKLEKNNIINIKCDPIVSKIPLDKESSNVSIYVIANEKYKSNLLKKEVLQSELGLAVSINSDVKSGTKLKTGDEVNITAKITNSGIMSDVIVITYELPHGLQLQEANASDGGQIKVYNGKNISYSPKIEAKGEIILQFKLKVDTTETMNETCTNVIKIEHNYETIKSNEIVFDLDLYYEPEWKNPNEPEKPTEPENPEEPDKPVDPENPENPEKPIEPEDPTEPDIPDEPEEPIKPKKKYNISGKTWLDENRDGKRDEKEKLLSGIKVRLLNSDNNSEFVKDDEGNIIEVTTKNNGTYSFENITEGKYLVVFEYDSNTYELTDYQKEGIAEDINSDATIYSKEKDMGITETINLDRNIQNIDIGLRNLPIFDLKVDKYISKVTVQTNNGVKVAAYENTSFAKTEIKAKEIAGSTVIVEYTIKITNNGQLSGKVKNIIDNMPSDMKFNSELNTSWHMDTNKRLNYTSLADVDINPKESKEIKLILVKNMTTENTGTTINTVEIEEYSNSRELDDSNLENNKASATIMITPATGTTTYIILITILLGVLGVGIYLIKKNQID